MTSDSAYYSSVVPSFVKELRVAIPSYWFFWTLAGGGGYNKRIKSITNPNNNSSKSFPKDLLEP